MAPGMYATAGIATVEGLVYATTKELGQIKGISEQKVTKLKEIGGCWAPWQRTVQLWWVLGAQPALASCTASASCCPLAPAAWRCL